MLLLSKTQTQKSVIELLSQLVEILNKRCEKLHIPKEKVDFDENEICDRYISINNQNEFDFESWDGIFADMNTVSYNDLNHYSVIVNNYN